MICLAEDGRKKVQTDRILLDTVSKGENVGQQKVSYFSRGGEIDTIIRDSCGSLFLPFIQAVSYLEDSEFLDLSLTSSGCGFLNISFTH